MKRIPILTMSLMFLMIGTALMAQTGIDRYFDTYSEDDRFTRISVSSKMFSLFVNFEMDDPDEQEVVETLSKLKGMKMLIGNEVEDAKSIFKSAVKLPSGQMEELMSVTDNQREFRFFITESNGMVSELLMVGYEDNQVMMLSIVGDIDLKQISALSKKMNIDGFEHLKNIAQ